MSTEAIRKLPKRAKRCLVDKLSLPEGTLLPCHWYEYPKASNMDCWPRERLREAAEKAGFIQIHDSAHYISTPEGRAWAQEQAAA
jgi:hypothetical protein